MNQADTANPETPAQPEPGSPAGWYLDPARPGWHRWWNGQKWTQIRRRDPSLPSAGLQLGGNADLWMAGVPLALGIIGVWFAETYKPSLSNALGLNGNSFYLPAGLDHLILIVSVAVGVFGLVRLVHLHSRGDRDDE